MLDKLIGPTDPHDWCRDSGVSKVLNNRAPKAIVEDVIFEGTDYIDTPCKELQRAGVYRFDPSRVDQCNRNAFGFQNFCSFLGHGEHISQPEECHIATMLNDFGLAYLQQLRFWFRFSARACPTRVSDRNRTVMIVHHSPKHVDKLLFVLRLHVYHVGYVPEIPNVKKTMVSRTIVT